MNIDTGSQNYKALVSKVEGLVQRWIKAWGPNTSYSMGQIDLLAFHDDCIRFSARPNCSGIGFHNLTLDLKYLDDDSTLETDAKAWYDNYEKKRLADFEEIRRLESFPEVARYRKMICCRN